MDTETNPNLYDATTICLDKKLIHISPRLVLVPYLPHHVPKYHGWMSNLAILQQTASESLCMEEEYKMQLEWALGPDKRTFIIVPRRDLHVLMAKKYSENPEFFLEVQQQQEKNNCGYVVSKDLILNRCRAEFSTNTCAFCKVADVVGSVLLKAEDDTTPDLFCCEQCEGIAAVGDLGETAAVGDVNLFIHDYLQDDDEEEENAEDRCVGADDEEESATVAEVEIMIAEESARRSGYGQIAIKLMTQYAIEWLGIKRFIAKISQDNTPSLNMFQNKLMYKIYDVVECFDEVHLDWNVDKSTNYPFFPRALMPPPGYVPPGVNRGEVASENSNHASN